MKSALVGRQDIYDADLRVVAYELLNRSPHARDLDGDRTTADVLVNALLEIGLDRLTGSKPGFVNFTESLLLDDEPLPFDHDRVVVEVLEDVPATTEIDRALSRLRGAGYRIALDDFLDDDARFSLVRPGDVVKVDLIGCPRDSLPGLSRRLLDTGATLLAEKVETHEEFERCRDLGFELFQGFFLARPVVVEGRGLPGNRLSILRLLSVLQDPHVSFEEVMRLLKQDVGLCVKLLRYVNSSTFGLRRNVESVQQAATMLGMNRIRRVVTLLATSGIDDKPRALFEQALVRARLCERLAELGGVEDPESCFTIGLFSLLDALVGHPLGEVLGELPLSEEVRAAVLARTGAKGELLDAAIAFERGEHDRSRGPNLDRDVWQTAYLDAVAWMESFRIGATANGVG